MGNINKKECYFLRRALREAVIAIEENKQPKGFLYKILNEILQAIEKDNVTNRA